MAFDFLSYMKNIAETHKDIRHTDSAKRYFESSGIGGMEDLLLNLQEAKETIMVVETNQEGEVAGKLESYIDIPRFSFFILKRVDFGSPENDRTAKQQCKSIAFGILGRMRHDKIQAQRGQADSSYNDMQIGSIKYDTVGPIATGWVGIMIRFYAHSIASENGFVYNEDDYE